MESSIEYCIVLDEAVIIGIERIEESLDSKRAKITQSSISKRFLRPNIDDYSEVQL